MYRMKFEDHGGSFHLLTDYGSGYRISATFATGSRAAYPEAIRQGRREALDRVARFALDFYNQFGTSPGVRFEGFPAE